MKRINVKRSFEDTVRGVLYASGSSNCQVWISDDGEIVSDSKHGGIMVIDFHHVSKFDDAWKIDEIIREKLSELKANGVLNFPKKPFAYRGNYRRWSM